MTKPEKRSVGSGAHDEAVTETATTWFVRMSADAATDAERRAFRAWLEGDPAHRDAYAQVEALWVELAGIPDPRPAREANGRTGHSARAKPSIRPIIRRPGIRRYAVLAACLLLMAVWGLWSLGGYDRLRADHATAVGETREVTLADGSVVHLNTDTAMGVAFAGDRRVVRLYRGEAFFTVARDQRRPFEVVTAGGVARAVGTAFNVRSEEAAMTVAVAEGRVAISRGVAAPQSGHSVILGPGEALRQTASGRGVPVAATVETLTAWRQGKLVFANRPLRAVVAELDRYRPGTIVLLSGKAADERFSGVVSLADTDRALAAIESTLPVDVIHLTAYLTLLRGRE
jgi:transmembrane sensor